MKIRIKNLKRQRGVVAIEFALVFPVFIFMILLWAEISFVGYTSAVLDMATSEAVRRVKSDEFIDDDAIIAEVEGVLTQNNSLWSNFIDVGNFTFTRCYYEDINSANTDPCGTDNTNNPVAIFNMAYTYTPIYNFLGGNFNLQREMIVILEFERSNT